MVLAQDVLELKNRFKFNVIPVSRKDKRPFMGEKWKQYQSVCSSEKEIEEWYSRNDGDVNVAVVCGQISSNLVVLDIDDKSAFRYIFGADPEEIAKQTLVVETSKGYHIYHHYTDKIYPEGIPTKLQFGELRGKGHYVVAPPSIHASGKQYQFLDINTKIAEINLKEFAVAITAISEEWKYVKPVTAKYKPGARHFLMLGFAGFMRKWLGYDYDRAEAVLKRMNLVTGDDEEDDRVAALKGTYEQTIEGIAIREYLTPDVYSELIKEVPGAEDIYGKDERGEIYLAAEGREGYEYYYLDQGGLLRYTRKKRRKEGWSIEREEYVFNDPIEIDGKDISEGGGRWIVDIYNQNHDKVVETVRGTVDEVTDELYRQGRISFSLPAKNAFNALRVMSERRGVEIKAIAPAIGVYANSSELSLITDVLPDYAEARNATYAIKKTLPADKTLLEKQDILPYLKVVLHYQPEEVLLALGYGIAGPFIHLLKDGSGFIPIILLVGPHDIGKTSVSDMITRIMWGTPTGHSSDLESDFRFIEHLSSTTFPRAFAEVERFPFDKHSSLLKQATEKPDLSSRGTSDRKVKEYFTFCHPILNGNSYTIADRDLYPRILVTPFDAQHLKERKKKQPQFEKDYMMLRTVGTKILDDILKRVNPHGGIDCIKFEVRQLVEKLRTSGINFTDSRRAYGYAVYIWGIMEFDRICQEKCGISIFKPKTDPFDFLVEKVVKVLEDVNMEESKEDLFVIFRDWFRGWMAKNERIVRGDQKIIVGENKIWKEDDKFYYVTGAIFEEFKRERKEYNIRSMRALGRIVCARYNLDFDLVYTTKSLAGIVTRVIIIPKEDQAMLPDLTQEEDK